MTTEQRSEVTVARQQLAALPQHERDEIHAKLLACGFDEEAHTFRQLMDYVDHSLEVDHGA